VSRKDVASMLTRLFILTKQQQKQGARGFLSRIYCRCLSATPSSSRKWSFPRTLSSFPSRFERTVSYSSSSSFLVGRRGLNHLSSPPTWLGVTTVNTIWPLCQHNGTDSKRRSFGCSSVTENANNKVYGDPQKQ
jgi:hypothetical protein